MNGMTDKIRYFFVEDLAYPYLFNSPIVSWNNIMVKREREREMRA
jgi:hypothetical protein